MEKWYQAEYNKQNKQKSLMMKTSEMLIEHLSLTIYLELALMK